MDDSFWGGQNNQPRGQILYGVLGEENPNNPGVYGFSSTSGYAVNDAHLLTADSSIDDTGDSFKPRSGSPCMAAFTTDGAQCFIIGFHRAPRFNEDNDDPPVVGNVDDNTISGDKVFQTSGGAKIMLKRGGSVVVEAGPGAGIIMNPLNNRMSMRSTNLQIIADGFRSQHGRSEPGSTEPRTIHLQEFLDQVGPAFDRWRTTAGSVSDKIRRRHELASVTVAGSKEVGVIKTRETYYEDGSWVGEGPKYQWGGESADEPIALGNELVDALTTLMDIIKNLKVATAWGPSGPPLPPTPIELEKLKAELPKKILSTFLFASKKPPSL